MVIKQFSEDEKNLTLEFNEFLKMIADENKLKKMKNQDEIIEAFRYTSLTKVLLINLLYGILCYRVFDRAGEG